MPLVPYNLLPGHLQKAMGATWQHEYVAFWQHDLVVEKGNKRSLGAFLPIHITHDTGAMATF